MGQSSASDTFFENQVAQGKRILEFVKHSFDLKKDNPVVFEIGCGAGGILLPFKSEGCSVAGCDLGGSYLEKGREKGLDLENGTAKELSKYGKADLIILSHVLEHFSDPRATLEEILKLLNEDGLLYVELPGTLKVHETYGDLILFLQNAHLYHFTLTRLNVFMNEFNLELVKGNEYIQSLFQKRSTKVNYKKSESHVKILIYLYLSELERQLHVLKTISMLRSTIMGKVRQVLGDSLVDTIKSKLLHSK